MELEPDHIVSEERWDFSFDKFNSSHLEGVKRWMSKGRLSKTAVHERFKEALLKSLINTKESRSSVEARLDHTWDSMGQHCSQESLINILAKHPRFRETKNESFAALLHKMIVWYASFPFEAAASPPVDKPGWTRAVLLLTQNHRSNPFFSESASVGSHTWRGHEGWFFSKRFKSNVDVRRSLFRSLAVRDQSFQNAISDRPEDVITVPHFATWTPKGQTEKTAEGILEPDDDESQIVFVAAEDERNADLLDVLRLSPVKKDGKTMTAPRDTYNVVLEELSGFTDPLHTLRFPRSDLALLWNTVKPSTGDEEEESLRSDLNLTEQNEPISWGDFNNLMEESKDILTERLRTFVGELIDVPIMNDRVYYSLYMKPSIDRAEAEAAAAATETATATN